LLQDNTCEDDPNERVWAPNQSSIEWLQFPKFTKDDASSIFIFNKATIFYLFKKHTYLIEIRMGLNGRLELMRVPFFSTTLKLRTMRKVQGIQKNWHLIDA
jgi:hypothetical protein